MAIGHNGQDGQELPMKLLQSMIWVFIILLCCVSCEKIAVMNAPAKKAQLSDLTQAAQAKQMFWAALHQGHYDHLSQIIKILTAAYIASPNDPELAAYLGFAHTWKLAERNREKTLDPLIVNQAILARKYFKDAVELTPSDPRLLGFYGVNTLVEGKIFADQKLQVKGYFILKRAINAWPEFNLFTAGYPMSILPTDSKQFREGLSWQWQTLDLCARQRVNRDNPDFAPFMQLATQMGKQRACWDSWIAPHNFEGFFLNMGDMLVKAGNWQTAIKIYSNAKLAPNYSSWKYRDVLEQRITDARKNVEQFNKAIPLTQHSPATTMMFNSTFSCIACHQQ